MVNPIKREQMTIVIQPVPFRHDGGTRGAYNGGILVPRGHPWFELDMIDEEEAAILCKIDVHGGVTATYHFDGDGDQYFIGFDTCWTGDTEETWPIERVAHECQKLLTQALIATLRLDEEEVI